MKITLSEIWNFLDLVDTTEKGWTFAFEAGVISVANISVEDMLAVKNDSNYDTEILPSLFTFREILWQPNVFTEASRSLPALRILRAYCLDYVEAANEKESAANKVYLPLFKGVAKCAGRAIKQLTKEKADTTKVLGELRTFAFPMLKFFIFHPKNRPDYYLDAINRLNYAVKIMLTEFNGRYTALQEPYWIVEFEKNQPVQKEPEVEQSPD